MIINLNFYFLILSAFFFFSSSAENFTATPTSAFLRRGGKKVALFRHLQVTRGEIKARGTHPYRDTSFENGVPTKTRANSRSEPLTRRATPDYLRVRVYGYLNDLYTGVQLRHRNIKDICAGKVTKQNAEWIGWKILVELRAILALCIACVSQIRKCGNSPSPSGIPTPGGGYYNNYSTGDLCQLIYRLICEFKECYKTVGDLCAQQAIIKQICYDCLQNISREVSNCLISTGGKVGGVFNGINVLYGDKLNSQFFNPTGFGFGLVRSILQNKSFY